MEVFLFNNPQNAESLVSKGFSKAQTAEIGSFHILLTYVK